MSTQYSPESTLDSRIALLDQLSTDTALVLPDGLPFDTWSEILLTLLRVERGIQWWLGDVWRYGEDHFGEPIYGVVAGQYAESTLRKYVSVSERIEPARRRADLSWSHHEAVAGLEPADQDKLLARAVAEDMTVHHVRAVARKIRDADETAPEHDYRCPACGNEWDGSPRP